MKSCDLFLFAFGAVALEALLFKAIGPSIELVEKIKIPFTDTHVWPWAATGSVEVGFFLGKRYALSKLGVDKKDLGKNIFSYAKAKLDYFRSYLD